jgi:CxxC-x17-CxxC domain-containing protein
LTRGPQTGKLPVAGSTGRIKPVDTGVNIRRHATTLLSRSREKSREVRPEKECSSLQSDRTLTCADCGQEFVFTASEQQFYTDRGFSDPRRCRNCRAQRKASMGSDSSGGGYSAGGGGGYSAGGAGGFRERRPREMFDATCSNCGKTAQVPFRPTSGKPVYCDDCFSRRRA